MSERVLPHNLEAERAVLGAILLHNEALAAIEDGLVPEMFFRDSHARIYRAMRTLAARKVAIDLATVREELARAGDLEAVNGPAYLAALVCDVPRSTHIADYAAIVREKATLRELVRSASDLLADAYAGEGSSAEILDRGQQRLLELAVDRVGGFVPMADIVSGEVMPLIERLCQQKRAVSGVPSGLTDFDLLTRGFQPSDLIIVAARPAMGKTALVMNAAVHAATVAQKAVGVFSLEMSKVQLGLRAVIAEARIDGMRVQSGRIYQDEWARLSAALETVAQARLHIDDSPQLNVIEIRARARRLQAQAGLDLLIVDYAQLMKATSRGENRNLELGEISGGLKAIAKDLNIPVIALSQLSRACETRSDKRPMLSDLRDSGALEADADVVVFIYRDEVYDKQSPYRGIAELSVAKHRNGPIGVVRVGFELAQTRFVNLEHGATV